MPAAGHALDTALALPVERERLGVTVERLSALGSSPLGFRAAGTPEDRRAADMAAEDLAAAGLERVTIEDVPVLGWSFGGARVEAGGLRPYEAASMGGVPGTGPSGVSGRLVAAGDGARRRLDRLDLAGAVALIEWRSERTLPADVALELGLRGAAAVILFCPQGGPHYQSPGALGSFDGHWHAGAPPMVTLRREDAAALAGAAGREVTVVLDAESRPAPGANAVGYLPGRRGGAPIVVGAHHDGWFRAAFDNASGVAAMLELARCLAAAGVRPAHTICFTSRTAEEFGAGDAHYDWCIGAHGQIAHTHPRWAAVSPFHLCVEASGHPDLRLLVEAPPELRAWVRRHLRAAAAHGLLPRGWRIARPGSGTELWPYLVAGVPGVSVLNWETRFARTDYHTQLDRPPMVDLDLLERLVRVYASLLLDADRLGERLIDHRARARDIARSAARSPRPLPGLRDAAERLGRARGRAPFTATGRALHALDAHGQAVYPHEQTARDLRELGHALTALADGDRRRAARHVARVGDNSLARSLSRAALARRRARIERERRGGGWAARSHLTPSPDLAAELATLRGEPGARPPGPWLERSLRRAELRADAELARRQQRMVRSLAQVDSGGGPS
jgi:hypothetical protein